MNPWVCPKCGRVYGPLVMQCASCNNTGTTGTTNPGWTPPIKRSTIEMTR